MKLYNTMSRAIEEFIPRSAELQQAQTTAEDIKKINPHHVGLYACGLTVYDYTHLGHLRKYTLDDVLIRTLRHSGYQVKFVQNVTDVGHLSSDADTGEDKLEKGAKKYGKSVWDIAREFEAYFFRSMDLMGNVRPDISCRATEHIKQQLEMVITLEKKGYAYVIDGDGVYFDTSKVDDYGKLARLNLSELQEGARLEKVAGKRNPTDFALWKFERPGENRAMVWESPWSKRSFPGWHIECSAMAIEYLGEQFDVHTGGIDHIPVHHTNEIAQAEAATGKKPFVKYWVHHNFLRVSGEKMSKSLGNFFTIDDVLEKGFDPKALRLLFLTTHYRSEMNFTWESLAGIQKSWEKLVALIQTFKQNTQRTVLSPEKLTKVDEYRTRFFDFMEDDLKTPEAIAVMWEVTKSNIPGEDKYDLLVEFDEVLGLGLATAEVSTAKISTAQDLEALPAEVQKLVNDRQKARQEKNWSIADDLRTQLDTLGFEVKDEAEGQKVFKK
jgi:cysteinyl-tRNA synthetase